MARWSNTVTVTVEIPFDVSQHTLEATTTKAVVGKPVTFNGTVVFTKPAPASYTLYVDVEVNGTIVQRDVPVKSITKGMSSANYSFTLAFNREGKYSVRAYAKLKPATGGGPIHPPPIVIT